MRFVVAVLAVPLLVACKKTDTSEASDNGRGPASGTPPLPLAPASDAPAPALLDDMVKVDAASARGRVPSCVDDWKGAMADRPPADVEYSTGTYKIDRHTVNCVDFQACVDARTCRAPKYCDNAKAVVIASAADAYCKWRGARLPGYLELQRALRGSAHLVYPTGATWDAAAGCTRATERNALPGGARRCEQTSDYGVVFHTENTNLLEWTSTMGCQMVGGKRREGRIAADMLLDRLDFVTVEGQYGEFRCAVDVTP